MLFKVFAVAGWAALFGVSAVLAQPLPGPAELPPAGFKGQQYVDSRGCVFLRAGLGGQVNWVARVSAGRKALCGYPPSGGRVEVASATEAAAPAAPAPAARARAAAPKAETYVAPGPKATGRPINTIATLRTPPAIRYESAGSAVPASRYVPPPVSGPRAVVQAPVAVAPQPVPRRVATVAAAPVIAAQRLPGCPAGAPYGVRATLGDGRATLFCSPDPSIDASYVQRRGAVTRQAAPAYGYAMDQTPVPRRYAEPVAAYDALAGYTPAPGARRSGEGAGIAGYGCPRLAPYARRFTVQGGGTTVMCTDKDGSAVSLTPQTYGARTVSALPQMPRGYKQAWQDDRLNPRRGIGSHAGQAAQDEVWTRELPARTHVDKAKTKVVKHVVVTSASNAPRAVAPSKAAAASGRYFVQVGTFGVAANAKSTAARLSGLGLPVAASKISRGGKPLQIVMAGPFGSAAQAKAALSAARRAGFGDAFIR